MKALLNKKDQAGMTYLGMLLLLIVIAFFAVALVKVIPLYLENFKVQSVVKSMAEESETASLAPAEIEKRILNRLSVNDVEHVNKEHIKISRAPGKLIIAINYEARVPLFMNLDLVAKFTDNQAELAAP